MIAFLSFILSLISYFFVLIFIFYIFFNKSEEKKEVLIHTAIISPKIENINKNVNVKNITSKKIEKKVNTKKIKKGSKSNITKGGDVDFNDLFKSVNENIDSTSIKLKKSLEMSRFKGLEKIEKNLKKIKNLNVDIFYQNKGSSNSKEDIDKVIKEITSIWYDISNIPGEYAKINFISKNNKIYVIILDSNLDKAKQIELINRIQSLKVYKGMNFNILFQTKVNK